MKWLAVAVVISLFIFFPRKMFGALGGVVLIATLIGSYFYYQEWSGNKAEEAVEVSIEYSPEKCEASSPLKIIVRNASDRVVAKVEWNIAIHQPGFSSDLAEAGFHEYFEDKILRPAEEWGTCVKVPELAKEIESLSKLVYSVKNKQVEFE